MRKFILLSTVFFCCSKMSHAQAGQPDATFGNRGIVKTDFGFIRNINYSSAGRQVWLQPDGGLYILIEASGQSYIAKRLPNGSPDVNYGNNGFSDPINLQQAAAAVQPDGKIAVAGTDLSNSFAVARYNTDGTIDYTFNGTGKQTTDFGSGYNIANAIAIQSDGKIVVTGFAYIGSSSDFALARYNTDGSLDSSFSSDGKQTTDFGSETNRAKSVAIQNDGKIVLTGQTYADGVSDFAVARYNSDGTLDNTFGNKGKLTKDFNSSEDIASAVAIQSDGKILIAGYVYKCNDTCSNPEFALIRYNTNGTADNTFNEDGKQITAFGSGYFTTSLAIQTNGKIVVVGYAFPGDNADFALVRFNTTGSLDNTFDEDGRLLTDFSSDDLVSNDFANSVAIESDGKIVVVGFDDGDNFDLARYYTDGRLDNTFSRDGKLTDSLRVKQGSTYFTGSAIQQDGKIVAAGYTYNGSNYDFALARYNTDGSLDNSFSGDGRQTTDLDSVDEYAYSVAIQNDGKIVLGGVSGSYFALSRYNTDGSLDISFGTEGKKVTDFGLENSAVANSVVIQSDGKILLAGYISEPLENHADFALARYNANGSTDSTFSDDGKLTTDLGYDDFANSAAIQSDGKIVLAGYSSISIRGEGSSFFAITRYNADGSLDNSFADKGKELTRFNEVSKARSVAIQSDGKIVAAGFSSSSSSEREDFALARYNPNGSLDNTFGENGIQISDFGSSAEYANSVAFQSDGKIIAAGSSNGNMAVARYNANGDLDNSFSGDGITITEASGQEDVINDIAIANNKLYAVGYVQYPGELGIVAKYLLNENKSPVVSLTIPHNIVKYSAPARIKLKAAVTDEAGKITKVQFYNGKTLIHTEYASPYGFFWINVPVGTYNFTAKAFDNTGNVTASNSINVSVADSNVAPVVSIVSPVDDTSYAGPAIIRLVADAKDPNDKISTVKFFNGTALLRTEYYYPYTYSWKDVQPGTYTITAVAADANGLSATSAPVTISVTEPNGTIAGNRPFIKNPSVANGFTDLKVSPNPARNTLHIYTNLPQQDKQTTISVISAAGVVMKTMQTNSLKQTIKFDVSSLVSGVYAIKVISGEKVLYKQFVKL